MGKNAEITLKSDFSDSEFNAMLDDGLSIAIGDDCDDVTDKPVSDSDVTEKTSTVSDGNSLEDKLNSIYNEFLADTTITIANIKDIAFREAAIKGRWCSRLMAERVRGKRLKQSLETLVKELGEMADSKMKPGSYLSGKMQKESIINANPEVQNLRKEISESREIQDFLTNLYDCIKGLGYTVKNSLDVLNLERGI